MNVFSAWLARTARWLRRLPLDSLTIRAVPAARYHRSASPRRRGRHVPRCL
ncbi:hypothetical protein [Microtetraspora fusca]|uniref:Uncharacterized protein n=1 Tax=Microtetraspora fusca TaxID=1997 RepID=A0ABW6VKS7_MICFU|nr:hypothetical protein [Microtetraspora fusca]